MLGSLLLKGDYLDLLDLFSLRAITWIFNVYPYRTKVLVYLPIGLATWSFLE